MTTKIDLTPMEIQGLCQEYLTESHKHAKASETIEDTNCNFSIINYKLKPISDSPSGFLGHHRFLIVDMQIQAVCNTAEKETILKRLRFFTKSAPVEIASRMEYLEEFGVFKKEISVYRDVLPRLQQVFAGVAPKCYYANNNLLVFEDLQQLGYRMAADRSGLLDYDHLNCAVKTLAAMHAASIVCDVTGKQNLNKLHPEAVEENAYPAPCSTEHVRYKNFANGVKVFKELIKQMPKYEAQLDFILNNLQKKMSVVFEMAQTSKTLCNVFSHGDLWSNNVMFEYGKYGDIPIQCRFVDFQLARYAPPMIDLITLLTIPTSQEFRSKYLMELLQNYYRFMEEFLKREQLSIGNYLTQPEFWQTFENFRIHGLVESCLFSHLTILPPALTQSLTASDEGFSDFFERKRVEICLQAFNTDQLYRDRLTDMFEDLVDNFILNKKK